MASLSYAGISSGHGPPGDGSQNKLTRQEILAPVSGMFHQARVVTVLLYSNDSWAVSLSALNDIESFHVEATRRMTGMHLQRRNVWPWIYPTSMDVFTVARLKLVTAYIRPRRHNITKTSIVRASLKEYRGAERRSGSSSRLMWWQQEMDLEEKDNEDAGGGGRWGLFFRLGLKSPRPK